MKNFPVLDILFIIISAILLLVIHFLGSPDMFGKYSLLVALIAYFIGKAVKGYEIKRK